MPAAPNSSPSATARPLSSLAGRSRKPPAPPGRNFVPIAIPAPSSRCGERPSGIPYTAIRPGSATRFTHGWGRISWVNGGPPRRSQRTDQWRSTCLARSSEGDRRISSKCACPVSGRRIPRVVSVACAIASHSSKTRRAPALIVERMNQVARYGTSIAHPGRGEELARHLLAAAAELETRSRLRAVPRQPPARRARHDLDHGAVAQPGRPRRLGAEAQGQPGGRRGPGARRALGDGRARAARRQGRAAGAGQAAANGAAPYTIQQLTDTEDSAREVRLRRARRGALCHRGPRGRADRGEPPPPAPRQAPGVRPPPRARRGGLPRAVGCGPRQARRRDRGDRPAATRSASRRR